ncbi:helix-turn-helix domain-containing protein [Myceligenerans sp. TRM 65318]|uniref:Helix-turn-helix domain-containing protein n=2 Tax=Myceligenerans pegani TaxID=2776917 RepID=A0ABR9MXY2_9MICO|nr:helix-turn-helix domain-containing protein [Myceligenerans sp. TRM 65318]MBE3018251.1 helix-turn-helix domain-containing protein [Myceligenerans sp. TRM 65318]
MLRTWRDRLPPSAVGLAAGRTRRATGLRREELAELAGISVDYVIRLEQGRVTTPSSQVTGALARALQLTGEERDHLYRLAGQLPPSDKEVSDHLPPGLGRVLNRLGELTAVAVFAADWHLIWWNRTWSALLGDPSLMPDHLRNFARDTFPVRAGGPHLSQWATISHDQRSVEVAVVSDLRRATGRFPRSGRLHGLVTELVEGNERFATLWTSGVVGAHREDRKTVHHPAVGPIAVDCDVISDGEADRKIVVLSAEPDSQDESRLQLALVNGAVTPGTAPTGAPPHVR